MNTYEPIRLRYGVLARMRDRRNAKRDYKQGGVAFYRQNNTTRYLSLINSEVAQMLDAERARFESVASVLQHDVLRADGLMKDLTSQNNSLKSRRSSLTSRLTVARKTKDFIQCAALERQIGDLTLKCQPIARRMKQAERDIEILNDRISSVNDLYKNNVSTIHSWGENREKLYIYELFRHDKRKDKAVRSNKRKGEDK